MRAGQGRLFRQKEQLTMAHSEADRPLRVINSAAPIRICDNGGWTDSWFAGHGKIFNLSVGPFVEVQVAVYPRMARPERVALYRELPQF
jgi:D-glycero-alpha-D-manno-heptose-7-phosphate kinase